MLSSYMLGVGGGDLGESKVPLATEVISGVWRGGWGEEEVDIY